MLSSQFHATAYVLPLAAPDRPAKQEAVRQDAGRTYGLSTFIGQVFLYALILSKGHFTVIDNCAPAFIPDQIIGDAFS